MKSQETLEQNLGETFEYVNQYLKKEKELLKLEIAEKVAKSTSALITLGVISFFVAMVLIMLSIALGFWLSEIFQSHSTAFFIITGGYAMVAVFIFIFRRKIITDPVLTTVLKVFFE